MGRIEFYEQKLAFETDSWDQHVMLKQSGERLVGVEQVSIFLIASGASV